MPRRRRTQADDRFGTLVWLTAAFSLLVVAGYVIDWVQQNAWIWFVPLALIAGVAGYFAWDWHRERHRGRQHERELELHQADEDLFVGRMMQLSPEEFEGFCSRILQGRGYWAEVTKRTGDGGVDIVLRAPDGAFGVAQCKRWLNRRVDRPILQKLYGEMVHRGAAFGIVLATCRFTDGARRWARDKEIELIDVEDLILAVRALRPI